MQFLQILLPIIAVVGIFFILMNVSYIIKKREFRGSCSTNNPMLSDNFGSCTVCGKTADEACKMPEIK